MRTRLTQTHKPGLVPGCLDRTKMFHVKHFGTIGSNISKKTPSKNKALQKVSQFSRP
jgi:hypothetical protein